MATTYVDDDTPQHNLRFSDIAGEPLKVLLPIEGYETMPLVSLEDAVEPLLHLLPDIRRKVWVAKQNCESPPDGLSADQSAAICIYSMEWQPRDECLYVVLNTTLRDRDRNKLKPWFLYLKLVLTALARLPSSRTNVYRGIKLDLIKDYPKGKTFVWWGFSSCTSSIDVLQSELFLGKTEVRTMFVIDCFRGKDIQQHSYYQAENEVLLLAATQFQVVASLDQGNGLHIIQLKEIDPPFPLIHHISEPNPTATIAIVNKSDEKLISLTGYTSKASVHKYRNFKLEEKVNSFASHASIDLKNQRLTDQDIAIVVQQAIINKQCMILYLEDNQITSKGASMVASALQNNVTLKELRLNSNAVCDKGVRYLAQMLTSSNSTLTALDLGEDSIKDQGAAYLAEMLKVNTILTHLYLARNGISHEGLKLLANSLARYNVTLKLLDLHSNKLINDSSAESLIEMLQLNQTLEKLSVRYCNLSWSSKSKLKEAAQDKTSFSLRT